MKILIRINNNFYNEELFLNGCIESLVIIKNMRIVNHQFTIFIPFIDEALVCFEDVLNKHYY
jgi:hypothetical protein